LATIEFFVKHFRLQGYNIDTLQGETDLCLY